MIDERNNILVCAGLNHLEGSAKTLAVWAGVHIFSSTGLQMV